MDAREVAEWSAYERISPLLPERFERLELMLAQLTATLFNANRGAKTRARKVAEFLPKRVWGTPSEGDGPVRTSTDEHIRKLGPLIAAATKATIGKKKTGNKAKG